MTFLHDPEYYDGPGWQRQLLYGAGILSRFPETSRKADILNLISTFRFSLATEFEPDRSLVRNDDRLNYVRAVTEYSDGVIFAPSSCSGMPRAES